MANGPVTEYNNELIANTTDNFSIYKNQIRTIVDENDAGLSVDHTDIPEPMSGQRWFTMTIYIDGMTDGEIRTLRRKLEDLELDDGTFMTLHTCSPTFMSLILTES